MPYSGFQYLEQRDAQNNITHRGVVSKESPLTTADNSGIYDVIAENFRYLKDTGGGSSGTGGTVDLDNNPTFQALKNAVFDSTNHTTFYTKSEVDQKLANSTSGGVSASSDSKQVSLASGVSCKKGNILGYKAGGYVLADNKDATTLTGVVLATEDSSNGSVKVLLRGDYAVDGLTDGSSVYVGTSGAMTTTVPTTSGQYIKCVGVVHGNILDFAPSEIAVQIA